MLRSRRRPKTRRTIALSFALLVPFASACGGNSKTSEDTTTTGKATQTSTLPRGSEAMSLKPTDFTAEIDNPYFPIVPGSRRVFRETDAEGAVRRVVVTVTNDTKTIIGIATRVVHDIVTEDGQVTEDTYDWYAQDSEGNLWYLGEETKEYENGKLKSTKGSWQAGVDGAQPGIIIPAHPKPGMTFREEYYAGQAEDGAEILTSAHMPTSRTAPSITSSRRGTSPRSSPIWSRRSSTPAGSGRCSRSR